jgi:hypothetical protein
LGYDLHRCGAEEDREATDEERNRELIEHLRNAATRSISAEDEGKEMHKY